MSVQVTTRCMCNLESEWPAHNQGKFQDDQLEEKPAYLHVHIMQSEIKSKEAKGSYISGCIRVYTQTKIIKNNKYSYNSSQLFTTNLINKINVCMCIKFDQETS